MEKKKQYLTKEGKKKIREELDILINVRRPEITRAITEARSDGDLSENADYHAAREEQGQVEARISELESVLDNAIIIKRKTKDKIDLGSKVSIKYIDGGDEEEYEIVGSSEANPFDNKISNESPIAKAIIGCKKGETVEVESPNGSYKLKILNIE